MERDMGDPGVSNPIALTGRHLFFSPVRIRVRVRVRGRVRGREGVGVRAGVKVGVRVRISNLTYRPLPFQLR